MISKDPFFKREFGDNIYGYRNHKIETRIPFSVPWTYLFSLIVEFDGKLLTENVLATILVEADLLVASVFNLTNELLYSILYLQLFLRLFVHRGRIRDGCSDFSRCLRVRVVVRLLFFCLHIEFGKFLRLIILRGSLFYWNCKINY